DEGYTAGSMTIHSSGGLLRIAAAEARRALLEMASEQLDAAPHELTIQDGVISVSYHPDRSISYAVLIGVKRFNRKVTGEAPLKRSEDYKIVGTSVQRVDIPAKLSGQPSFVQDVRVPGMLHGRIVYPPSPGAALVSLDENSVKDMPGLVKIVRRGNFLAVVAEREEQAIHAARQLKVEWRVRPPLPRMGKRAARHGGHTPPS